MMTNLLFSQTTALCKTLGKRLAMVLTVLFTLGVGSMLGQTFTRISSASDLSDGDEIIFVNQDGTYACGTTQNNNNRTPVAITTSSNSYSYKSSDNVQVFIVKVNGSNYGFHNGSGYIYSASSSNNYLKTNTTASTTAPSGTAAWTLSVSNNVFTVKNASNTSYYLAFNGTSYFSQYKSGQSKPYIYKKVTSTYKIIAKSNNDNYGTVSLSGTTITASPKTGYTYANPAYEVTSGTAKVTQNGNTFTVTPSSDCSIQINFAEKVKNTYIDNVQGNSTQTLYDTHSAPSLTDKEPATTGTCEQQHWHFMGWVTEANKANLIDANIVKAGASVTAGGTTYYAVWAKGETTNGASTSKQYSFDITKGDFNTTSYVANNNSKTSTAKASDNSTKSVSWTSNQVMQQSSTMQWQSSKGYIYNTTDLGNITNITITSTAGTFTTYYGTSQQPSQETSVGTGNGYFQIKVGSATGKVSNIKVTFTQTVEGETTTTYSDYITTCTTETTVTLNPNGGEIDNNNWTFENGVYKLTTNDESITLPEITRTGYTFGGWATSAGGSKAHDNGATISLNGTPVTLYAIWKPITYTITYELDGGTNHASNPANYTIETSTITLQAPNKDKHTFGGWYEESTFKNQVTQIEKGSTGNITLYAKWVEIPTTCTVTYNANGGIGTPPSDETKYTNGATVTVLGNYGKLTKDGYAFTGWNTAADGRGTTYKAGDTFTISANTTLYAQWCEAYWKLVTDAAELENDTRIVIAAKDEAVALSTTQNTNNRGQVEITKKYNTIVVTNTVQIITLELGTIQNTFAFNTGNGYLYAAGANSSNYLKTQVENNIKGLWEIAINAGNTEIVVTPTADISHNILKHNSTSDCFSCYEESNNQKAVVIYKEVCVQDLYNVNEPKLTNATADNNNPTTVAADATSLTLNYSANTGYLLPETITVKMGGALLVATTDYTWDKATGTLTINVTGFYGDIDVKIVAEEDPCYQFAMSEVTATSTTPNSITLTWNEVTGATGYNVRLGDDGFIAATGLTHTFTGLNPKTSYTWEVQAVKGTCQASQTGSITTQKETFTVSWVVNGNTTTTESVVDGESITQYPSDPSAPSGCHEKVFVGWTDNPINTPTNEAPAILYKQKSDVPAITDNTTLRAVWADVIGGGETTKSLLNTEIQTFHKQGTTTSYSDLTIPSTDGDWSGLFCTANSSSVYTINLKKDAVNDKRPYLKSSEYNSITKVSVVATHASTKGNRILYLCNAETDSPESNNIGTISVAKDNNTSQVCTLSSSATTLYLYVDNGLQIKTITLTTGGRTYSAYTTLCDECTPSTLTLEADNTTADLDKNGNATITFTTTGGNGGEITYAANPKTGVTWENGTATFTKAGTYTITASQEKNGEYCPTTSNTVNVTITATPHLYFVTEPAPTTIVFDPVECGGNTPLANKKSVELQGYNLTGNVTATVTGAYKIARTSSATLGEYSTLLTLDKNNDGKINGNYDVVYILSCPPAGGTASTEGTLTFTITNGNTLTVNLSTPTVTCTPHTLTFSDRGNTLSSEEYYAGNEIAQPEDPTGVCTIPVNYIFDGWAEAEVTNGSTEYTKVTFPYSMPNKATTLYAVYRYADGNASENKFMSVDKEIGELESGKDYVLTGYYETDKKKYALSITEYETGKYKTKQVDVQESSTKYDDGSSYYELETTDGEIIWTIVGDDTNGYTFQNKSNNKYLNIDGNNLVLGDENDHTFTIEHETDVIDEPEVYYMSLLVQPKDDDSKYLSSYYKSNASQVLFNLHTSNTLSLYLYKRAASYLYTTNPVCDGIIVTYDWNGGTHGCAQERIPAGDYTICSQEPVREGHTFLGWSDGTNTYQAEDVIPNVEADITLTAQWQILTYTVTWSNNGATTDVEYNHGDALVLPTTTPASCDGVKDFMGWTALQSDYYHATDAPSDLFTTASGTVTTDATYYAVFATPPGTGSSTITTVTDQLTRATTGIEGTTYNSWSGKTVTSSAVYAGQSAGGNDAIQLRSSNSNSGIITTTSGGKLQSVIVEWNTNTTSDRTLDIYGRNVAYTSASELYSTNTQGTKLGSIVYGTSTTLEITGEYEYIGLRSKDGAMYLNSITIEWTSSGVSRVHTDYATLCQGVTSIEVQNPQTAFTQYDDFTIGTGKVIATLEGGSTTDVTSRATFSGYDMTKTGTQTVTVTYMGETAKYEITVAESDRWHLTWNVNGKTNTGLSPRFVQKGSAIGTLPTPVVPDACEGKTFMGWTTSNIVNSDGTGITYITSETVPTDNTTYYAVFATVNNFSVQKPIEDIESGSKVVIVAVASLTADGGSGKAISSRATDDTHNLQGDDVAIYDQTINTPHSTCIWTITKSGEKYIFTQDGKYLNGIIDGSYSNLKYNNTSDSWTLTPATSGMAMTYNMKSTNASTEYVEWYNGKFTIHDEVNKNGDFDMQFFVTANANGEADITDYTTGCTEYTITYYGFRGGYSTSTSSDGTIVLPVNSEHTIPDCGDVVKDHTDLGRKFLNVWMTQPHGGHTFKPGDTFILTQDTTLYAQWEMETTSDVTTLPTDIEDLAGTDVYVYGGKTLTIEPGTTTINSLTLKGGLQADGSYSMPNIWVPAGATLIRNNDKIYLDLLINSKNYYPFAVPFAAKNGSGKDDWTYVGYLDPDLKAAATYGKHFDIKTYDGARRAEKGEDRENNWVHIYRDTYLEPGVGYIITAMTRRGLDTVTIRIPMKVPNTWFYNGEQTQVGSTTRNTREVTAHTGAAATSHTRHAGWNFVASPYLSHFSGGNMAGNNEYINGEIIIDGGFAYGGDDVPYVTIPTYDFSYYTQHKLSDVKLSPEYSFFVQIGTNGTMDFATEGRIKAPASIAARSAEARNSIIDIDIILSDKHQHSDQTGIILSEYFSELYEIGRDLEKMFGSAYNLCIYSLMADNTPLAFQALAIQEQMQTIPLGYRAPENGEYTFSLNTNTSNIEMLNYKYEQLILIDYLTGAKTDLLQYDYTFETERTQDNTRFALSITPRKDITTDILNNTDGQKQTRKVLYNNQLYIIHNGQIYNGVGQTIQ